MATEPLSFDISDIIKNEKKSRGHMLPKTDDLSADRERIKVCISEFKGSIVSLFKEEPDIESFKLIPNADPTIEVSIYHDKVCFDKKNSDGSFKNLVLDFRTGTLKSNAAVLSNVDALESLFSYLESLYNDFSKQRATLYERKFDDN